MGKLGLVRHKSMDAHLTLFHRNDRNGFQPHISVSQPSIQRPLLLCAHQNPTSAMSHYHLPIVNPNTHPQPHRTSLSIRERLLAPVKLITNRIVGALLSRRGNTASENEDIPFGRVSSTHNGLPSSTPVQPGVLDTSSTMEGTSMHLGDVLLP